MSKSKVSIFVFGSNTQGRHGKGAALTARLEYGAISGQARGRQGNSYAIVTKDISPMRRPIPLSDIQAEVTKFIIHATSCSKETFFVTKIGCGLAGYKEEDIAPMFHGAPDNCILPAGWREL